LINDSCTYLQQKKNKKINKRDLILANEFYRTLYLHNNFVYDEI